MHATRDRMGAAPAARGKRPATAQPAHLRLDPAGVMVLQRAVGNAATGAVLARLRVLARRPDEAKVRARAYELYQRSGGGVRSREEEETNYFEALRQVEIEERAHAIWEERRGDAVANYYEAERQIAEERKPKPSVEELKQSPEAAKPVIEEVKPTPVAESKLEEAKPELPVQQPRPSVEAAKPVVEEVKPPPVAEGKLEEAKPTAKYVPPRRREGYQPSAPVVVAQPTLAPGEYYADQLTRRLGFKRKAGNHLQRDVRGWNGFDVHVSVYTDKGKFDELHVKFDRGASGSAWFFFDTAGNLLNKTTAVGARKQLLRAAGCPDQDLQYELGRMTDIAQDEAAWVVGRLQ